jgi:hypothetical protein
MKRWMPIACILILLASSMLQAQTTTTKNNVGDASHRSKTKVTNAAMPPDASSSPVAGSGTAGQITKWLGFNGTAFTVGDSGITEDKYGNVGIGSTSPTSKLTVVGMIETTLGGYKFPDGTIQSTAAVSGLTSIFHDATLTGNGTSGSPLGIAVPLSLSGSLPTGFVINASNVAGSGGGIHASGGPSNLLGGLGALLVGGNSANYIGGSGAEVRGGSGGSNDLGQSFAGGAGLFVTGGNGPIGGLGMEALGGDGTGDGLGGTGGNGIEARGGAGSHGRHGGDGIVATAGQGDGGAGRAGTFYGDVLVTGNLSKGGGSFKIDHPLDPENKYLYHSFVESPDMLNIYNGNVKLDSNGEATVELPEWFGTLNRDFRYSLTALGIPGPNLYIAAEVANNNFKIAGGTPGAKVSWTVTGIRQDAWANAHRIPIEENKSEKERGHYLHPELYGQPEEKGVEWARHPEMMKRMSERKEQMKQEHEKRDQ